MGAAESEDGVIVADEQWRDGRRRDHMLLEDQMVSFTGLDGEESPDILDACVYGCTELLLDPNLTAQDHLDALKRRLEKAREGKQG